MNDGIQSPELVEIGDRVGWLTDGYDKRATVAEVVRVTNTQIIVHDAGAREYRFNRQSGRMRGDRHTILRDRLDPRVVTAVARRAAREALDGVARINRGAKLADTVECLSVLSDAAGLLDAAAKEINKLLNELDAAQAAGKGEH